METLHPRVNVDNCILLEIVMSSLSADESLLYDKDLLHLLEDTFDRKRISVNLGPNSNLKHNNVFRLTK